MFCVSGISLILYADIPDRLGFVVNSNSTKERCIESERRQQTMQHSWHTE